MRHLHSPRRTVFVAAAIAALTGVTPGRAALLTDFSNSYAQYQATRDSASDFDDDLDIDGLDFLVWQRGAGRINQANKSQGDANADRVVSDLDYRLWSTQLGTTPSGIPDSVAFKLYFDPEGIVDGQVTVVVDAPQGNSDRFALGADNGLLVQDPRYDFFIESENVIADGVRIRYEAKVRFISRSFSEPPSGPVTLFGYQVQDLAPTESVADVETSFQFDDGDFISVRDEGGFVTTFFDDQLDDVVMPLVAALVLDVDVASGFTSIRNPTGLPVAIQYYEILSAAGSLNPAGWISFDDLEGDPPGFGWEQASASSSQLLSEANVDGQITIDPDVSFTLGAAFNVVGTTTHDLRFRYVSLAQGYVYGVVNYVDGTPATAVPEPGAVALAGVGLAAAFRRRKPATLVRQTTPPRAVPLSQSTSRRLMCMLAVVAASLGSGPATAHAAIYIANYGPGTVSKYTNRGTLVNPALISGLGTGFDGIGPGGLAVTGGVLYVGVYGPGGGLRTYTPNGTPIGAPLVSTSRGDVTIAGGVLYLSHSSDAFINRYTPAGSPLGNFFITGPAFDVVVSGTRLYSASFGAVGVYNSSTGATINSSFITGLTNAVSLAHAQSQLFVADEDQGTIGKYDALTGAAINATFISGLTGPSSIAVSGSRLIVACNDQTLRFYDLNSGDELRQPVATAFNSPSGLAVTPFADFNEDGDVNVTDFLTLTANLHNNVASLTLDQAAALGDLNEDRIINGQDFFEFRQAYDDYNGPGAFVAMLQGVPEPTTAALSTAACLAIALRHLRRRTCTSFRLPRSGPHSRTAPRPPSTSAEATNPRLTPFKSK